MFVLREDIRVVPSEHSVREWDFGFGLELLGDGPLTRVFGLFVLELCFIKALTISH